MGAITTILYMSNYQDLDVRGLILDSPLSNLEQLVISLIQKRFSVPGFLISGCLKILNMKLKSQANMDIQKVSPIDHIKNMKIPAIFISGTLDTLVPHE